MTEKQAMKKSLEHWKKIIIALSDNKKKIVIKKRCNSFVIDGQSYNFGFRGCALCSLYGNMGYCTECPISLDTSTCGCDKTPWKEVVLSFNESSKKRSACIWLQYEYLLNVAYSQGLM